MVGPSIGEEERESLSLRLKVGFALLVGASGALVAIQAGATAGGIAAAGVGGSLVGIVLVWYLVKIAPWRVAD